MMQNSGLGNAVSPLTSLTWTFRLPQLLIVTWRGQPGVADEPQHALMGPVTPAMLDTMEIPWETFPTEAEAIGPALDRAMAHMDRDRPPVRARDAEGQRGAVCAEAKATRPRAARAARARVPQCARVAGERVAHASRRVAARDCAHAAGIDGGARVDGFLRPRTLRDRRSPEPVVHGRLDGLSDAVRAGSRAGASGPARGRARRRRRRADAHGRIRDARRLWSVESHARAARQRRARIDRRPGDGVAQVSICRRLRRRAAMRSRSKATMSA